MQGRPQTEQVSKKELFFANFRVDKLEAAYYNKAMS